jgi:hypothetical protein
MLQAWLSIGYIVLLAILVLAFILWRRLQTDMGPSTVPCLAWGGTDLNQWHRGRNDH